MPKYCLVKELAKKMKKALKSGEISKEKLIELANVSSKERKKYFESFVGTDNAKDVNLLFERKLLNKDRTKALISWAKEITGIKPAIKRDLISKIEKINEGIFDRTKLKQEYAKAFGDAPDSGMTNKQLFDSLLDKGISEESLIENGAYKNLLDPETENEFLEDLASSKLGVDVSLKEAREIKKIADKIDKAKTKLENSPTEKNRISYGNKIIDMYDKVGELKPPKSFGDQVANIANVPRGLMSTFDFSAPFRQGFGMVTRKEFWKNLTPMLKAGFNEKNFRDIQADIITRPTYDTMKKANLRITGLGDKLSEREEEFMTTLLDKIPGIRGSERAYTAFLSKLRADAFDDLLRKASLAGENIKPGSDVTKDLATVVNNFTGSGKIGKLDQSAPILNSLFFSPRKIASTINKLNPWNFLNTKISRTARVEHLKRLLGQVGVSAGVLSLAKMAGAEIEPDPRSSDFGKIKIGNTRFDVTGGDGTFAVLLARLISGKTKSTTSESISELGDGFGKQTRGDIFVKYFRNKLSPTASFIADYLYGSDAIGQPFKLGKEIGNRAYPLIIQDSIDTAKTDPTMAVISTFSNLFGIGASTYNMDVDWNDSTTKELKAVKEQLTEEDFNAANKKFNDEVNKQVESLLKTDDYKALNEENKREAVSSLKRMIKEEILDEYGYVPDKVTKTREELLDDYKSKQLGKGRSITEEGLEKEKERIENLFVWDEQFKGKSKEEQQRLLKKIKDKTLKESIEDKIKTQYLTTKEKKIISLGVEDGERALEISKYLDEQDNKRAAYKKLDDAGGISKKVEEQLKEYGIVY